MFEKVGQDAARRLAGQVFRHVHDLSLRFHLERRTGSLTKIVERGTKSIDMMLYFLLFNIAPTVIELAAICVIFFVKFGAGLVAATLAIVAVYIAFTRKVTDWRAQLQRQMNDVDNKAIGRAVEFAAQLRDGQIFRRRGARGEALRRSDRRLRPRRGPQRGVSLAWLNIGQSLITNVMMAGAMIFTVWGWSQGRFTPGDVVLVNSLLMQLFRPLDMLGWVYRSIRQGLIDMEAMWDLLDTPAEVVDTPGAPAAARHRGPRPLRERALRLRARARDPEGPRPRHSAGDQLRDRRAVRRRQVDHRPAALPLLRSDRGPHPIDGQDIAEVTQTSLRAAIGIVPQDTVLFNDTIGYNIGYGRDGAARTRSKARREGAAIDRFIAALPGGL